METATLGGGCFWCLEAVFAKLIGVEEVRSGYSAGETPNPTYSQVCTGTTGHAEVIQVLFNPALISFRDILEIFFNLHDPTTLNRQGADVGTQYRSAIFYHTEAQRSVAHEVILEVNASGIWDRPIVTEVTPVGVFYPAEEYHQKYYERNPNQGYCRAIIAPKMIKLQKLFSEKLVT